MTSPVDVEAVALKVFEGVRDELVKMMPFGAESFAVEVIDRVKLQIVSNAIRSIQIDSRGVDVEDWRSG